MAKKIFTVTSPEFIEFKKWCEKMNPKHSTCSTMRLSSRFS